MSSSASGAPDVFGVQALPDQSFLLCHRRHVTALCMSYKVNSNSNPCLFGELPSDSVRVRHTLAGALARPLEFEVSRVERHICEVFPAGPDSCA